MSLEKLAVDLQVNPQDAENIIDFYIQNHSREANTNNLRMVRAQVERAQRILAGITQVGETMERDLELSKLKVTAQQALNTASLALTRLELEVDGRA